MANSKTLKITGIPPDWTNGRLEEIFEEFGPLKRCFIVKKKDQKPKDEDEKPLYGYVQFALEADAKVREG